MQVSLLEAQAAVAACRRLQALLLEPPSDPPTAVVDQVTGVRKAGSSLPQLQQLIPQVRQPMWVLILLIIPPIAHKSGCIAYLCQHSGTKPLMAHALCMHPCIWGVKASWATQGTLVCVPTCDQGYCMCAHVLLWVLKWAAIRRHGALAWAGRTKHVKAGSSVARRAASA